MPNTSPASRPTGPIRPLSGVGATDPLRYVRRALIALTVAAAAIQLLAFGSTEENLLCTLLALAASWLGIARSLDSARFQFAPVSALILLFFTVTATAGALLVKTLEWSPLVDRLQVPLLTFTVLLLAQAVLLLADLLYARPGFLQNARRFVGRRIYDRIGLMHWQSDGQLWVLGLIGCVSVMLTGTDYESGATFGLASAGAKLIRAFGFLKFAPFLIPFRRALSGDPLARAGSPWPLAAYFCGLVLLSFATNSRSTFADAIPTIGICVLMALACNALDLRNVSKVRVLVLLALAAVAAVVLGRVALAMVVVREYRYGVDVQMLISLTLEALMNPDWLAASKAEMDVAVNVGGYSETYVDSRFFARFLLTKFHDNMLYYFSLFGDDQLNDYKQFLFDRMAGTLPDPLLRMLGIPLDKQALVISNGDYVVYIVDGWGLGGFKTGSMIGEVYSVFGWGAPLVLTGAALMLFVCYDPLVQRSPDGRLVVSPIFVLLAWNLCGTTAAFGLASESVTAIPAGIVRGLPQNILFYLLASLAVGMLFRLAGWSDRRPIPPARTVDTPRRDDATA